MNFEIMVTVDLIKQQLKCISSVKLFPRHHNRFDFFSPPHALNPELFVTLVPELPYSMEISRISGGSSVVVSGGGASVVKMRSPEDAGFPAASNELTR
jgi:hypothetical protein